MVLVRLQTEEEPGLGIGLRSDLLVHPQQMHHPVIQSIMRESEGGREGGREGEGERGREGGRERGGTWLRECLSTLLVGGGRAG